MKSAGIDWCWYLRCTKTSRTLFNKRGCGTTTRDRKKAQIEAMGAYLMWIVVKLLSGTDDARELFIDGNV